MKFNTKIIKIGGSLFVNISNNIKEDLEEGEVVNVNIEKLNKKIVSIICPDTACRYKFSTEENDIYDCPACGKEIISSEVNELDNDM